MKIARNVAKVGVHACLSNDSNISSNFNSEKFVRSETPSCSFAKVCLKGVENSSEHHEIWHALLSTKVDKSAYFNPEKVDKSAYFKPWFDHP